IEEHFYLLWPFTLICLLRFVGDYRRIALLLICGICAIATWRGYLFWANGSLNRCYFGTDTRADALLCGCLTAFLSRLGLKISRGHAVAGSIVFTCLLLLSEERHSLGLYFGGLTVIAIAAGFSLLWLLQAETAIHCAFRLRPLTWIGQISYSLYLWHYPIVKIMQVFPRSIFITILTLSLVFVAASASF